MAQIYGKYLDNLQTGYFRPVEDKLRHYGKSEAEKEIAPISLNPALIAGTLGAIAFILAVLSAGTETAYYLSGYNAGSLHKIVKIFSLDLELNVPNFFSTLNLLFAATLLAVITFFKRKQNDSYLRYWAILAVGFLYMAFDEIASAHEKLIEPMQALLGKENLGALYFAWVVPIGFLVLFLAGFFFKFWLNLPPRARFSFLVAGVLYVGGAVGMELVGGRHFELYGSENLTYIILTTIEESLELAGVIVFIWALLDYISKNYNEVLLRFKVH